MLCGNPPFEGIHSHIRHSINLTQSFEVVSYRDARTATPNVRQNAFAMNLRPFGVWFPTPRVPYSGPGKDGRRAEYDTSVFVINQSPPPTKQSQAPTVMVCGFRLQSEVRK